MDRIIIVASINAQIEACIVTGKNPASVFEPMLGLLCDCTSGQEERREEFLIYLEQLRSFTFEIIRDHLAAIQESGDWIRGISTLVTEAIQTWSSLNQMEDAVRKYPAGGNQTEYVRDAFAKLTLRLPFHLVERPAH